MRFRLAVTATVAVVLVCASVRAEPASTLLEKGVYLEETAGDLDGAIQVYKKIVADSQVSRRQAAEALYRLGSCQIRKKQNADAAESLQKVVRLYPEQKDLAEKASRQLQEFGLASGGGGNGGGSGAYGGGNGLTQKRAVGRGTSTYPAQADLSSPETACVAWNRAWARLDTQAIAAVNWYETAPAEIEAMRGKAGSEDWQIYSKALQTAVVVEVWTYKDDLAGVITYLQFPPGKGSHPFSLRYMGQIDGQWKNYGEDRLPSLREARETFQAKQQRIGESFQTLKTGKLGAAQPGALKGITIRKIDKTIPEFPAAVDLSTPETACAAYHRAFAGKDGKGLSDLTWHKTDPAEMTQMLQQIGAKDPEGIYLTAMANARIVQVLTYREDLADVIVYLPFPPGKGRSPYSCRGFGRFDGQWKNVGEDRYQSLEEAIGSFDRKKDNIYKQFLELTGRAGAALNGQPADRSTPASTIRGFHLAAAAGDVELAMSYVLPGGTDYDDINDILTGSSPEKYKQLASEMFKALDPQDPVEVTKTSQQGDKTEVVYRVKFAKEWTIREAGKSATYKAGDTFEMDATLRKVGDEWLIDGI